MNRGGNEVEPSLLRPLASFGGKKTIHRGTQSTNGDHGADIFVEVRTGVQHGDASAKPLEKGSQANSVCPLQKYVWGHKPVPGEEVRKLFLQLL